MSKKNCKARGLYEKYFKRPLDIFFSFVIILVLSPILLIIYLATVIFLGFPGLFKQDRPGKNEKVFKLYKFRTMTNARDKKGRLLPDDKRLTKFGKFLRSTSLDELPELFNILKGDMSFVGPRPLLAEYIPYYTSKERRRHDVRPGMTGLAQVSGRNSLNWDQRFALDIKYINSITFKGDLAIVFKTIGVVFKRSGISDGKSKTMTSLIQERGKRND